MKKILNILLIFLLNIVLGFTQEKFVLDQKEYYFGKYDNYNVLLDFSQIESNVFYQGKNNERPGSLETYISNGRESDHYNVSINYTKIYPYIFIHDNKIHCLTYEPCKYYINKPDSIIRNLYLYKRISPGNWQKAINKPIDIGYFYYDHGKNQRNYTHSITSINKGDVIHVGKHNNFSYEVYIVLTQNIDEYVTRNYNNKYIKEYSILHFFVVTPTGLKHTKYNLPYGNGILTFNNPNYNIHDIDKLIINLKTKNNKIEIFFKINDHHVVDVVK